MTKQESSLLLILLRMRYNAWGEPSYKVLNSVVQSYEEELSKKYFNANALVTDMYGNEEYIKVLKIQGDPINKMYNDIKPDCYIYITDRVHKHNHPLKRVQFLS